MYIEHLLRYMGQKHRMQEFSCCLDGGANVNYKQAHKQQLEP